ncbi:MAG TPA: bacterioferritin-associated ferredoxin [Steroidobacteraceae bacterium]|nr:bacterioferritin-associated ferredoxin [Steroidobacteraceae bacterium]
MYVCICRGVTDSQIRRAVDEGAASLSQVRRQLAVAACCGRCAPMARDIIRERSQAAGLSAAVPSTLI